MKINDYKGTCRLTQPGFTFNEWLCAAFRAFPTRGSGRAVIKFDRKLSLLTWIHVCLHMSCVLYVIAAEYELLSNHRDNGGSQPVRRIVKLHCELLFKLLSVYYSFHSNLCQCTPLCPARSMSTSPPWTWGMSFSGSQEMGRQVIDISQCSMPCKWILN